MSTDIRHAALTRLEAAKAEVTKLEAFLAVLEELTGSQPAASKVVPEVPLTGAAGKSSTAGALSLTQGMAFDLLKSAGRPMHTRELLDALLQRGIEVGGLDPASTLSARLSRAPLIENVRPYGWRIKQSSEEGEAVGPLASETPTASVATPHSADEDGREVEHENTDLVG